MKKWIYLLLLGVLSLQCAPRNNALSQRQLLEAEYKVPSFSNAEVQDHVYDFLVLMLDAKSAADKNETKEAESLFQRAHLLLDEFNKDQDKITAEESKKLLNWTNQLLIQLNPVNR